MILKSRDEIKKYCQSKKMNIVVKLIDYSTRHDLLTTDIDEAVINARKRGARTITIYDLPINKLKKLKETGDPLYNEFKDRIEKRLSMILKSREEIASYCRSKKMNVNITIINYSTQYDLLTSDLDEAVINAKYDGRNTISIYDLPIYILKKLKEIGDPIYNEFKVQIEKRFI